ncbi:MAG: lytic murein transglycosylase [Pseudomonadota bacterium]
MLRRVSLNQVFQMIMVIAALCLYASGLSLAEAGDRPNFETWLTNFKTEALSLGISQATLEQALDNIAPIQRVIELDRRQLEFTLTLHEYLDKVVPESLVKEGREKLERNRELLANITKRYHVPAHVLVALWGIETKFGRVTGDFPVINALATLAYDGRRRALFTRELLSALQIIEGGHITVQKMRGSWAGAMGQVQFMPSSFQNYGADYDGDGRIDIWNNMGDILASAANYLFQSGWKGDQLWGQEVRLPKSLDRGLLKLDVEKRLSEWQALGVLQKNGQDLPLNPDLSASIIEPDGPKGRAFIAYSNFRVILKWNWSNLFAIAVGTLSDRIGED